MAYYVPVEKGPDEQQLESFTPSSSLSFRSAVARTFEENPSVLLTDYSRVTLANRGPKLDNDTAREMVRQSGVKLDVPEDGYTSEALGILIKRRQDAAARESVDARTPWGFGSLFRGSAQLLTGLVDPLNIASAFIPVVGEARAARWLTQAGEGAAARFGARAVVGVAEGSAGAAIMEPAVYGLHAGLQDDYSMVDSLINIGFGGALGGVLHGGAGLVKDALSPPARKAISAEVEKLRAEVPDSPVPARVERMVFESDLASVTRAPFATRAGLTEPEARAIAIESAREEWKAQLLAETSGRAAPREVANLRSESAGLEQQLRELADPATFKRLAKEAQANGMSRKQAEAAARKQIAEQTGDVQAKLDRGQQQVDANARAAQAEQDLAAVEQGQIPDRFAQDLQERTQSMLLANQLVKSLQARQDAPASFVIGMANPQTREAAMRSSIASMMQGRRPDVDALIRRGEPSEIMAAVRAQQQPESMAVGSIEVSRAADERLKTAPADESAMSAKAMAADADKRLQAIRQNLELAGFPAERLAEVDAGLKSFDAAVADAKNLGNAILQHAICGLRQ